MTKSKGGRIIYILTAVSLTILGLLFIISCAHLFFTGGETPYSRERVGEYLSYLAVPSAITVLLIITGFVFAIVNDEKEDRKTARTDGELLESFLKIYDFESFDNDTKVQVRALKKRQNVVDIITSAITSCCCVFIFDYLIFIAKFTVENLNDDVTSAFAVTLPIGFLAVAVHFVRAYLYEKSAKEELALLKNSLKEQGAEKVKKEPKEQKRVDSILVGRVVLLSVATVFIVLGVINGGMNDVLEKAIKICTECIGLG